MESSSDDDDLDDSDDPDKEPMEPVTVYKLKLEFHDLIFCFLI